MKLEINESKQSSEAYYDFQEFLDKLTEYVDENNILVNLKGTRLAGQYSDQFEIIVNGAYSGAEITTILLDHSKTNIHNAWTATYDFDGNDYDEASATYIDDLYEPVTEWLMEISKSNYNESVCESFHRADMQDALRNMERDFAAIKRIVNTKIIGSDDEFYDDFRKAAKSIEILYNKLATKYDSDYLTTTESVKSSYNESMNEKINGKLKNDTEYGFYLHKSYKKEYFFVTSAKAKTQKLVAKIISYAYGVPEEDVLDIRSKNANDYKYIANKIEPAKITFGHSKLGDYVDIEGTKSQFFASNMDKDDQEIEIVYL